MWPLVSGNALLLVLGQWHLLHFLPFQHSLSHTQVLEICISGGEQSDVAVLGISCLGKTYFHRFHTQCKCTSPRDGTSKTPLQLMNVLAVVLSKCQHGISVLLRAVSSLNESTVVIPLGVLNEPRSNTTTCRLILCGSKCMLFPSTTALHWLSSRKFWFMQGNKGRGECDIFLHSSNFSPWALLTCPPHNITLDSCSFENEYLNRLVDQESASCQLILTFRPSSLPEPKASGSDGPQLIYQSLPINFHCKFCLQQTVDLIDPHL